MRLGSHCKRGPANKFKTSRLGSAGIIKKDSSRCASSPCTANDHLTNDYFLTATATPSRTGRIVVKKSRRGVKLAIEFHDRLGGGVGIFLDDARAPKHVIGYEQSALLHAWGNQPQHARIVVLVDVVEDDVEDSCFCSESSSIASPR